MIDDGGEWFRRQALALAKNYSTPVSYWLSITLRELHNWIITNNVLVKEMNNKGKQ